MIINFFQIYINVYDMCDYVLSLNGLAEEDPTNRRIEGVEKNRRGTK